MFQTLMSLCTVDALPALPHNWWLAWSLAPATLLPLAVLALQGVCAWPDGRMPAAHVRRWRLWGVVLLGVALVSPLCRLAATLAAGHMAQLMVLVAGCAVLGAGWPAQGRRRHGPLALCVSTAAHGALLWLWHAPGVYAATLTSPLAHVAMTAALAFASFLFWREVLHAAPAQRGAALLALLLTMTHTGLLGALLTFAGTPLYELQAAGARAWGMAPLVDQQVAGLLMWVPGGLGYMGVALVLAVRWGFGTQDAAPSRGKAA